MSRFRFGSLRAWMIGLASLVGLTLASAQNVLAQISIVAPTLNFTQSTSAQSATFDIFVSSSAVTQPNLGGWVVGLTLGTGGGLTFQSAPVLPTSNTYLFNGAPGSSFFSDIVGPNEVFGTDSTTAAVPLFNNAGLMSVTVNIPANAVGDYVLKLDDSNALAFTELDDFNTGSAVPNVLLTNGSIHIAAAPTFTPTTYNLSAGVANSTIIVGGSTNVSATITNVGTGTADTLDFNGLTVTPSGGSVGGPPLDSSSPLANTNGSATNSGLSFSSATSGTFTLTPKVDAANTLNHNLATVATPGAAPPQSVTVLNHSNGSLAVDSGATNFGSVLVGTPVTSVGFHLANAAGQNAGLQVDSVASAGSNSPLTGGPSLPTVIAAGNSSTAYSAAIDTSTVGAYSASHTFTTGDDQSLPGHNALAANLALNITGDVLDHASGSITPVSGSTSFGNVIVGASVSPYVFSLQNASGHRVNLQVNSVASIGSTSSLSGPSLSTLVAPGSSTSNFTAGIDTSTVGAYSATHTFTSGDDQSITGHGALSANLAVNITGNVLDHASGSASLTAGNNFQAIAGTTGLNATVQIANAAGSRAGLQVGSPDPTIGSGLLSGGPATPYLVVPGGHQDYTATFDATGPLGAYSNGVSFTAGDDQTLTGHNSLESIAATISGTLLAHATGSFASSSSNTFEIDFGTVPQFSAVAPQGFSIHNLADPSGFTAALELLAGNILGAGDTSRITTNLSSISGLAGGDSQNFLAALNTSVAGSFVATYSFNVGDLSTIAGHALNEGPLVLTLRGQVTAAVPEPTSLVLMLLGGIGLARLRTKRRK